MYNANIHDIRSHEGTNSSLSQKLYITYNFSTVVICKRYPNNLKSLDPLIKGPAEDSISEGEQETELVSDKVDEADEHDEAYEANETDKDDEADEDDETDKDVAAITITQNFARTFHSG